MLKGTYVFKQNGIEVGRSENIVTTNGKTAILKYIANPLNEWASSLAVGAINTAEQVTDKTLYYEVARSAVTLKSYKIGSPNILIVKGTIDASVSANIYEVGVYPLTTSQIFGTRDQLIIDDFSNYSNWTGSAFTVNSFSPGTTYSNRVGLYSLNLPSNGIITNSKLSIDPSKYSTLDTFDILADLTNSTGSLSVTFKDVNGLTTTTNSYPLSGYTGYKVVSFSLPAGIFNLSTITSIQITLTGSTTPVILDAIRISTNAEITDNTSLVSRSTLTSPIAKIYGVPLDIEYYLQII